MWYFYILCLFSNIMCVCDTKLVGIRPLNRIIANQILTPDATCDNMDMDMNFKLSNMPKKIMNDLLQQNYYLHNSKQNHNFNLNDSQKVISISPAGLKGFYSFGVALYLKEHYELQDIIYSGASAGSWIALYMAHKGDPLEIPFKLMEIDYEKISSVFELQVNLKNLFLDHYTVDDFDMNKMFVGVTGVHNLQLVSNIYSQFDTLIDALDACIASSHIPFISGGLITKYNDVISFDGGLVNYPYVNFSKPILHINPSMWKSEKRYLLDTCTEKDTLDLVNCYIGLKTSNLKNVTQMLEQGYSDCMKNRDILDSILTRH